MFKNELFSELLFKLTYMTKYIGHQNFENFKILEICSIYFVEYLVQTANTIFFIFKIRYK